MGYNIIIIFFLLFLRELRNTRGGWGAGAYKEARTGKREHNRGVTSRGWGTTARGSYGSLRTPCDEGAEGEQ